MQNTSLETSESHQASGQASTSSNANNRTTKYSPMRKPETASAASKQQHFGQGEYHVPPAKQVLHKVNYLQ